MAFKSYFYGFYLYFISIHPTVTDFARFLGLCDRITSLHEVSVPQTPQRTACAMTIIQRSRSLQDCGVCVAT